MGTIKSTSRMYLIDWYGPFHCVEEVSEWEQEQGLSFHLYLLQGKKRNAKNYSYYCGQTNRSVAARFKDKQHPINQLSNQLNIWIGAFASRPTKEDIDIAENLLICILSAKVDETRLLNKQGLRFQSCYNVCLIPRWSNPQRYKLPCSSIKSVFPQITFYNSEDDEIKFSQKLRLL